MKKFYVATAVAVVSVAGFAGVQQVEYQNLAQTGAENLVAQLNGTRALGKSLDAVLQSHEGGLLSSQGVIVLDSKDDTRPTRFEIHYTVNHGLTTILDGATYTATITNTMLNGQSDKTLTSVLWNGQPILANGTIAAGKIDGVMTAPEIAVSEPGLKLTGKPMRATFSLSQFDAEGNPEQVEMVATVPLFKFADRGSSLTLANAVLDFSNRFDGKSGSGRADLTLDKVQGYDSVHDQRFGAEGIKLSASSRIDAEFASDVNLQAAKVSLPGGMELSDAELKYRLSGLDGSAYTRLLAMAQQAATEGWSEVETQNRVGQYLRQRADELLAHNPKLQLESLRVNMAGKPLISARGNAVLDSALLPPRYLEQGFASPQGPNLSALVGAASVDFSASFGREAQMLAATINPFIAMMISQNNGAFSFRLDRGQMEMNGVRL